MQIRVRLERINSRNVRVVLLGLLIDISPLKVPSPHWKVPSHQPAGRTQQHQAWRFQGHCRSQVFWGCAQHGAQTHALGPREAQRGVALEQFADVSIEY